MGERDVAYSPRGRPTCRGTFGGVFFFYLRLLRRCRGIFFLLSLFFFLNIFCCFVCLICVCESTLGRSPAPVTRSWSRCLAKKAERFMPSMVWHPDFNNSISTTATVFYNLKVCVPSYVRVPSYAYKRGTSVHLGLMGVASLRVTRAIFSSVG